MAGASRPSSDPIEALKAELERFGEANDAATSERPRRMLSITRDTGEFLAVLVRATAARRVLEIGTSNDYSTRWLAEAAEAIGGAVTTLEDSEYKVGLAQANLARSGLSSLVVDNATSHAEEMAPFVALVKADPDFASCLVPVGKGEFLAVKTSS